MRGAFLAGALGLLDGRRATTNFHLLDALKDLGARPFGGGEIVIDGKFVTAGPVTGSFEAALTVLGHLRGREVAEMVELTIEFDPHPPFGVGSPETAGPVLTAQSIAAFAPMTNPLRETARRVYERRRA